MKRADWITLMLTIYFILALIVFVWANVEFWLTYMMEFY